MTAKRFTLENGCYGGEDRPLIYDNKGPDENYYFCGDYHDFKYLWKLLNALHEENEQLKQTIETQNFNYENTKGIIHSSEHQIQQLQDEIEQLKAQLYCDDEEGICNICKHHYLVKDDEIELGYYNSRCKKGHCECARVSLKYCKDFEKELKE